MAKILDVKDFPWCCDQGEEKCNHGSIADVKAGVYGLTTGLLQDKVPHSFTNSTNEEIERGDILRCRDGFMVWNGFIWLEVKRHNDTSMLPSSMRDLVDIGYFADTFTHSAIGYY
jgi:hypothetical protein